MADLTEIASSQSVKIAGANPATGQEDNYLEVASDGSITVQPGNTANTTPWLTTDTADGPVTPGTAATKSGLIGGQYNTSLPVLTNTQQSAIQVDSSGRVLIGIIPTGSNTIGAVTQASGPWTFNLTQVAGSAVSLGQKTMANSIPVVLSSDQTVIPVSQSGTWTTGRTWVLSSVSDSVASVQSGTWTTGRTWTLASGTDSISAVQSGTWNINNISGTVSLPTGAATEASLVKLTLAQGSTTSGQSGPLLQGAVSTASPSYTTAQTSPLSLTTAGALRVDNSGVTQPISAASLPLPSGASTSALQTTGNSSLSSIDGKLGTLGQKVMTGSAPVVIASDQSSIPVTQSGTWNITNVSGTVSLPTGASTSANQTTEIASLQLLDNPIGSVVAGTAGTNSFLIGGVFNSALPTVTNGQQVALQLDSSGRVIISPPTVTSSEDHNYGTVGATTLRSAAQIGNATGAALFGAGTTTAQVLRVVLPTDQTAIPAKLQDNSGNGINSNNNQLQVRDVINTSGQHRAQTVTTTAAEALGAATILVNRKFISITPTTGTVYWGFSNTVTTSSGTPIFKNTPAVFAFTDNVHIYLICSSGTVDCRIAEGS